MDCSPRSIVLLYRHKNGNISVPILSRPPKPGETFGHAGITGMFPVREKDAEKGAYIVRLSQDFATMKKEDFILVQPGTEKTGDFAAVGKDGKTLATVYSGHANENVCGKIRGIFRFF